MIVGEMRGLIAQAMLAPSVHNVQPARWRIERDSLLLLEDIRCRLPVGDPRANDAGISLGCAAEGLCLAASLAGQSVEMDPAPLPPGSETLLPVARYRLTGIVAADPLARLVDARRSWRGDFMPVAGEDRNAAHALARDGAAVITDEAALARVARLFDAASYGFMRDDDFRRELLSWMRLSPRHPRWNCDGLNAEAMAMSRIEAIGAGVVLGPAFRPLDRLGIAPGLLGEGKKVATAAAVVVFHRPRAEAPFDSGRHFYRLWLQIEQAGFGAAVLAALADDPDAARTVGEIAAVPADHRVVSAFRIGRRPAGHTAPRARRTIDEVLV